MSLAEVIFVVTLLVVGDIVVGIVLGFFLAGDADDNDEDNRPNYL